MPFDPFDNKHARAIVTKISKGKSLAPLKKVFDTVIAVRANGNLEVSAINDQQCDQCLALAEIVAAGRGNGGRKVTLPAEAAEWMKNAPAFEESLAEAAKAAVDEVRSYSAAWAIAEDIGWREWTSYCRGLSSRLDKPARKGKLNVRPQASDVVKFFEAKECGLKKEKDDVIELTASKPRQLTDADLEQVVLVKKLKSLTLHNQKISDKGLALLSALKRLESLSIRDCPITGGGFRELELPRLKQLAIGPKGVNDILANCGHLRGLRSVRVASSDLADSGLKALTDLPLLERLEINYCRQKKGDRWSSLKELKKLKEVSATTTVFSSTGIEALLQLTNLHQLGLHYAKYPVSAASALSQFKRLRVLDLSGLAIAEAEWEFLGKLKKLKELTLNGCPNVTDQTIEIIAQLPALQGLRISSTAITNKSEKLLAGIDSLRSVNARQTKLSRAAQDRLDRLFESRRPDAEDDD